MQRLLTVLRLAFGVGLILFGLICPNYAEEPLDPRISHQTLEAFQAKMHISKESSLPYRLMPPLEIEDKASYPLILFLHGFGERGNDNQRQLIHFGSEVAKQAWRERYPAFVFAPQCPDGIEPGVSHEGEAVQRVWTWRLARKTTPAIHLDQAPSPQLLAVQSLVAKLLKTLPIDTDRVYVTGLSMGGYGTWEIITRNPNLYAAAAPICGAGDPTHARRIAKLPIWAFHGAVDQVVPVERSEEMIKAIRRLGCEPIFTKYDNVGHDSWTATYGSQHVWDWLFAQRLCSAP